RPRARRRDRRNGRDRYGSGAARHARAGRVGRWQPHPGRPGRRRVPGDGEAARMIRVLLADDQHLVRAGFRALLERTPDIEVVGEATDGEQAIGLARQHRPDVVLMDVRMPRMDGIAATRSICAETGLGTTKVVILTTFEQDEYVYAALRAG